MLQQVSWHFPALFPPLQCPCVIWDAELRHSFKARSHYWSVSWWNGFHYVVLKILRYEPIIVSVYMLGYENKLLQYEYFQPWITNAPSSLFPFINCARLPLMFIYFSTTLSLWKRVTHQDYKTSAICQTAGYFPECPA